MIPTTEANAPPFARLPAANRLARPGVIAVVWVLTTLIHIANQLRFPDFEDGWLYVSSVLFLASVPVLAAFAAAAVARSRDTALAFAGTLMALEFSFSLLCFGLQFLLEDRAGAFAWTGALLGLLTLAVSAVCIIRIARARGVSRRRRWAAMAVALSFLAAWPALSLFDEELYSVSARYAAGSGPADPPPQIDEEQLWTAQPRLVDEALAKLASPPAGEAVTTVVAVGAGGTQRLFGREARLARQVLGRAFGAEQRGFVLANDEASLERAPLATNANLDTVLAALGKRANPKRGLVVIYLTAHGNQDAELSTNLPDYTDLRPIGAKTLAAALAEAGIRRRIIIVSACYSGTWIKPLASPDTIVVTAARADRTSFGCSDERELTYFGEALLKGPLASGASLADSFRAAKRTVTRWESAGKDPHSEPQAFVGDNMTGVWNARPSGGQ